LEDAIAYPFEPGSAAAEPRILITGAGGQLGTALKEEFPQADARRRPDLDVTFASLEYRPDVVLHAAAWTDVDGAEENPSAAEAVNIGGTRNVVAFGAPVVYFSTDYVFDGEKGAPYIESDEPNPLNVYGRTKLAGEREVRDGWIIRSSWLFGATGRNFLRAMLALADRQDEVQVVDDQRGSPTYVAHLAAATKEMLALPRGTWHIAADGDCSWAEFAEAIFEETSAACRVVPIASIELSRPAQRPAYSVLRSERANAPRLPHWREGLRECLDRM
jgi:dTDP-4-dehydrorhamnose reductase